MAEGGKNMNWLRPVERRPENTIGTHTGRHEALNVRNPQPGYRYYYPRRGASEIQAKLNQGWRMVRKEDPESWGIDLRDISGETLPEMDGLMAYQDVVLMKIPEEKYRILQEEKQMRNKVMLHGPTDEYLSRGESLAARVESTDPLYHKLKQHAITSDD